MRMLATTLALLAAASTAFASTDLDTFKRIADRAALGNLCICRTDDANNNLMGTLTTGKAFVGGAWRLRASCYIGEYEADGRRVGSFQCYRFELLDR